MSYFKLPDLGEGLAEAQLVEWFVAQGDRVVLDQPLLTVETDKALVEVPSPTTGRVVRLLASAGDLIHIGGVLVEFEGEVDDKGTVVGSVSDNQETLDDTFEVKISAGGHRVTSALPATRLLARKLGINIDKVKGSGANGLVTREDVEAAVGAHPVAGKGEVIKGARRAMAKAMVLAHESVVPVTITEEVSLCHWSPEQDVTVAIIKAIGEACRAEPSMNAWFDGETLTRRLFGQVNIGIAVDSKHGLYVPVLNDVTARPAADIRLGLDTLIADVKARSVPREMLKGASITLTNFGAIGGLYASPVVSPPQVAIIGVGRMFEKVIAVGGGFKASQALPVSITFDHRACTGGEAARFIKALVNALSG